MDLGEAGDAAYQPALDDFAPWLEVQVLPAVAERILPVDTAVARRIGP